MAGTAVLVSWGGAVIVRARRQVIVVKDVYAIPEEGMALLRSINVEVLWGLIFLQGTTPNAP